MNRISDRCCCTSPSVQNQIRSILTRECFHSIRSPVSVSIPREYRSTQSNVAVKHDPVRRKTIRTDWPFRTSKNRDSGDCRFPFSFLATIHVPGFNDASSDSRLTIWSSRTVEYFPASLSCFSASSTRSSADLRFKISPQRISWRIRSGVSPSSCVVCFSSCVARYLFHLHPEHRSVPSGLLLHASHSTNP